MENYSSRCYTCNIIFLLKDLVKFACPGVGRPEYIIKEVVKETFQIQCKLLQSPKNMYTACQVQLWEEQE